MKQKIAILAFYFPPDQSIGSVRPFLWAKWLSEAGYDVTVISGSGKYFAFHDTDNSDTNPSSPNPSESQSINVVNASSPIIRFLLKYNAKKIKNQASPSRGKSVSFSWLKSLLSKISTTGVFRYRMPCLYDFWFLTALHHLIKIKPNKVIATHSPYISLLVGLAYKIIKPNVQFHADYRDMWSLSPQMSGLPIVSLLERFFDTIVVKKSEIVTTVSNGQLQLLETLCEPTHKEKLHSIYNASEIILHAPYKPSSTKFIALYAGTFSNHRNPYRFFDLLRSLMISGLINKHNFQLQIASRNPQLAIKLSHEYGIDDLITNLGYLPRNKLQYFYEKCDALYLLESSAHQNMGS